MSYQIISDSSCDLGEEIAKEHGIKVVPFYVTFDGVAYQKELEEIEVRQFYQKMVDFPDVFPKSSLPTVQDYVEAFRPYAAAGQDIICMCISTKFSGSYNAALNARELIVEEFPQAKVAVVDCILNTVAQGQLVLEAARMRDDGLSFEENVKNLERIKHTGRIIFTVGSFDYLIHGGRIGKVKGAVVSTLGVKPMILLKEGEIFPTGLARSRKNSKRKLLEQTRDYFEKAKDSTENYRFALGYGYDKEEALEFSGQIQEVLRGFGNVGEIEIYQIGCGISVHTGPYALGLGFVKKYDC